MSRWWSRSHWRAAEHAGEVLSVGKEGKLMSLDKVVVTPTLKANGRSSPPPGKAASDYRNQTWQEAEGQREACVRLDRLPPNLNFPDGFPEPITYDPARKQLKYRGLMFSGSYTYLRKLSADPAYLAALDQLFIATSAPARSTGRWFLVVAALAAVALAVFSAWWFTR